MLAGRPRLNSNLENVQEYASLKQIAELASSPGRAVDSALSPVGKRERIGSEQIEGDLSPDRNESRNRTQRTLSK